jgi:probable HAF family extracellular repeat protein
MAVSGDGTVVVGTDVRSGSGEAFRWTAAEGRVGLGDLPGGSSFSQGLGVSEDGSVVVGSSGVSGGTEAFRWTAAGGMQSLGALPGGSSHVSIAEDVSDDGSVIVGRSTSASGHEYEAFRWTAGDGMMPLGGLPGLPVFSSAEAVSADGSVVVGWSQSEAFRWTPEEGMVGLRDDVPGSTRAADLSADGAAVIGTLATPAGYSQLFRWTAEDGVVPIGELASTGAFGTSADATIIVGQRSGHAAAWDLTLGPESHDIAALLTEEYGLDLTGWDLQFATDVSSDGHIIVGYGRNPSGQFEGWRATIPSFVPEPGTLGLLGSGLGALASVRRLRGRRRRLVIASGRARKSQEEAP